MDARRVIGLGVRADQASAVVAAHAGLEAIARRLGVSTATARVWRRELGLTVRPAPRGSSTYPQRRLTNAQVEAAIESSLSLHRAAFELDVTAAALHVRARRLGLPTDQAGRAALREGACA